MSRMDFARALRDARASVAQIKEHLSWPSYKVKEVLDTDKWALKRELKEAEDWLAWLEANAPEKIVAGVAAEGVGTSKSSVDDAEPPPFNLVGGTPLVKED